MMSEKKKNKNSRFSMLLILPITAIVLMGISIQNSRSENDNTVKNFNKTETGNDDGVTYVSKNELFNMGELTLNPDDSEFSQAFIVVSFTVSTMAGDYEESYDQNHGPTFTKQQIDLIKRARSGRKLYIENIKALGPEGEIRDLGSIVFKIK